MQKENLYIYLIELITMTSALISGGNGFLGSHFADKFIGNGFDVTVVDNFSTTKKKNLHKEAALIKKRIEDYKTNKKYDFVIHLATRPSPEDYISKPVFTISSNSLGTYKMLEIAKKSNATFMYTSSSEVFKHKITYKRHYLKIL